MHPEMSLIFLSDVKFCFFIKLIEEDWTRVSFFFRYAKLQNVPAATAHRVSQDDCTELRKWVCCDLQRGAANINHRVHSQRRAASHASPG